MYAIEFETDIQNGVVKIPDEYPSLKNRHARVVILLNNDATDHTEDQQLVDSASSADIELHAISNHSAGQVEEWHESAEDDVWK